MTTRRKVKIVRPETIQPDQTWAQINDFHAQGLPAGIGEGDFQANCESVAQAYGWTVYHETDSRKSPKGLPDLIMLSPIQQDGSAVLVMLELKTMKGKVSDEQEVWLTKLGVTNTLVTGVLRPDMWLQFVQLCFDPSELQGVPDAATVP